eukprot:CAMPEP_0175494790 /NCGR_PEP_ID=MMETSP0096-20121207/3462_1 /TAXON_ID=311494 /ORGANISM="Alexandrium monilatum, Strain CCMP3105" /LENGTH=637 /DNA_ID=CAMNT_0016796761 /DNA_START=74 /DNA_END=1984 /DNA_ORIENTATION=-
MKPSSANCLPLAVLVCLHRLEGVVGHVHPVAAALLVLLEDLGVVPRLHSEPLQAAADETVLAARAHVGVLAHRLVGAAHVGVVVQQVHEHGAPAEDLNGPEHRRARAAVVDAPGLVSREVGHVLPEAVREEGGIGVDLDRPVVVPEGARPEDGVPGLNKDLCVQPGTPAPLLGGEVPYRRGDVAAAQIEGPIAEDRPLVAPEEAQMVGLLVLDQFGLLAGGPRERPTVERGARRDRGGAGPQGLARPWRLLRVVPVHAGGAVVHADGPARVLLVALHASTPAAPHLVAAASGVDALARNPLCKRCPRRRYAGRPRSERRAVPGFGIDVTNVGTRLACVPAAGPPIVLLEAQRAGLLAADALQAVLAGPRAPVGHPGARLQGNTVEGRGRAGRGVSQRSARPWVWLDVRDVEAGRALRLAARPPLVLREARHPRVLATPRLTAILPDLGALLGDPVRRLQPAPEVHRDSAWAVLPDPLAGPRREGGVDRVRARVAEGPAHRPAVHLLVARHARLRAAARGVAVLPPAHAAPEASHEADGLHSSARISGPGAGHGSATSHPEDRLRAPRGQEADPGREEEVGGQQPRPRHHRQAARAPACSLARETARQAGVAPRAASLLAGAVQLTARDSMTGAAAAS